MVALKLYKFNELNETAQKRAIEEIRERCFEENSNLDFDKAYATMCKIIELANVVPLYYGLGYANPTLYYNKTLEEKFTIFKNNVKNNLTIDTIFDSMIKDIIDKWDFNRETDYLDTIDYIFNEFDKAVISNNYRYKKDENVIEYINANDSFHFLEDGRFIDL